MAATQTTASDGSIGADELFRRHAPFVARFLFRLGVEADAIEDAVQEVFLVVHRQGGYRPGPAKPTSYLANLAIHAASASRRRERARRAREGGDAVDDVPSKRSDPVQLLEAHESLRRLQDALDRLEPELRTTLVLVDIEGESCASIAAAMSIPVGTVYWRLHHARKRFQRALQAMEAARPHRAMPVRAELATMRPARKERAGMIILLMTSPSWTNSDAHDLLRLGAARPPLRYAVQEGLARHRELAASGAPAPSWSHGLGSTLSGAAKGAIWIAVSGAAAIGAAVTLATKPVAPAAPWPGTRAMVAAPAPAQPASRDSVWTPSWTSASPAAPATPSADLSIPVEALPIAPATPASSSATLSATRGAVGPEPGRDARRLASDAPPSAAHADADPTGARDTAPNPPPASPSEDDLLEIQEVARAERMLATDPAQALALAHAAEQRFPRGYVLEERRYVEIMALVALGRTDEARPKAARFLRDHPESAFARRVREASRRAQATP
ncbi:MAG TPA: sigma-70 family RNA polymerase sigma factor [Polyangiaceae bacterium]|nr:sigma-70 family RNA polymerase sigma factor [Polyangiaceae bacterium]